MNPLDHCLRLLTGDALAATDPDSAPPAASSYQPQPVYVTAFEMRFRAVAADEARVLERLAVETAALGSWEAARTLFAPDGSCAGLYATQTPEPCPSRVSVPPDAHKPAQPLPTQPAKETNQ